MKQANKYYPKFEAGQVLTSEALNNYFGYLDEQTRLTRAQLLGVGVISGLDIKLDDNTITITKGTAVTPDGYLIDLPEDTVYTIACEYNQNSDMIAKQNPLTGTIDEDFIKVLDHVAYVLYEDEKDATKHNQYLNANESAISQVYKQHYILGLMIDFVSQDSITKCSELSCDIVLTNYQIEFRLVLFNTDIVNWNEASTIFTSIWCPSTVIYSIRDHFTENSLNGHTYNDYIKNTSLRIAYDLSTSIRQSRIGSSNPIFKSFNVPIDLEDHLQKFFNKEGNFPSYYLQHIIDLAIATQELCDLCMDFSKKYDAIPTEKNYFQRVVTLGEAGVNPQINEIDVYHESRQYNSSILHDPQFLADYSMLYKALYRIYALAEEFDFDCQLCYGYCYHLRPHAKLEERITPRYYDYDWSTDPWYLVKHKRHEFEKYDSLVFEDYYGMSMDNFIRELEDGKKYREIPFTIDFVPVGSVTYVEGKYNLKVVDSFFRSHLEHVSYDAGILMLIEKNNPIGSIRAREFLNTIRQELPFINMDSCIPEINVREGITGEVRDNLAFCLDYVRHYAECKPNQIGGCPYDGRLSVFYDNNDENRKVLLVVGSNNTYSVGSDDT